MRFDQYSNPILSEQDLFDALYKGFKPTFDDTIIVDRTEAITKFEEHLDFSFVPPINPNDELSLEDFDRYMQAEWNMPEEYKKMDIENWVLCQCKDISAYNRSKEELEEYKARNMLDLLRWLKYFVDTCSKEGIVWGVGRGSSVASYVLYIIGVHNIDPIKYNLDWREFLR
jgi:DNA polymerase III alpha subunit